MIFKLNLYNLELVLRFNKSFSLNNNTNIKFKTVKVVYYAIQVKVNFFFVCITVLNGIVVWTDV